jgi:hypothetical protein
VLFLARLLDALLAEARAALGAYVGADPDDLVFVPNATAGLNVAACPLELEPGDEVLSTDLEYGSLELTWEHVCGDFGARYVSRRARVRSLVSEESGLGVAEGHDDRAAHRATRATQPAVRELCAGSQTSVNRVSSRVTPRSS